MVKRFHLTLFLLSALALLNASPQYFQFWSGQGGLTYKASPPWGAWRVAPSEDYSFIWTGEAIDCVNFSRNAITIRDCNADHEPPAWKSPDHWKVTEVIVSDLNRDGMNELSLVVWRPHQSWPVDTFLPYGGRIADFKNTRGFSCHVILIGWDGQEYRELWAGSALIDPVSHLRAADLDGDGNQELVALEGSYASMQKGGNLTIWDWNGFGFRLRERVSGNFSDLGIVSVGENVLIITN